MSKAFAKKVIFLVALPAFFIIPLFSFAQDLEIDYPAIGGEAPDAINYSLPRYVKYVFTFAIGIIGLVALGVLFFGGFLYLTSAGNVEKMREARERLTAAALGIVILLSSYIILSTINPELVLFDISDLPPFSFPQTTPPPEIKTEDSAYIAQELPLAQSVKAGLWSKESLDSLKQTVSDFESFLKQNINTQDSDLENPLVQGIASLHKHLSTLTHQCRPENLKAFCTSPESGCMPINCIGDPCQTDQDAEIEPDSPRGKINTDLAINAVKKDELIDFQEKIKEERNNLRGRLTLFQEIEGQVISCQNQNKELIMINDYLSQKQDLEKRGIDVVQMSSPYASRGNTLTFYCSAGGTVFDAIVNESLALENYFENSVGDIGCPVKYNTGETFDKLREYAVEESFRMDRVSDLIEDMVEKIQDMQNLVSQCNDKEIQVKCGCYYNYCYGCCSPVPCAGCVPFCRSRCIQCSQGCTGIACPTEEINKKAEEIKAIEDELLFEIQQIKEVIERVPTGLQKMDSISQAIGSCQADSSWGILSCKTITESFFKTFDKTGQQITDCHPKDLYCCTVSNASASHSSSGPFYISPARKFEPLPAVNNCPKGWNCTKEVTDYNQYKDASEPLKQLLACMRIRLDAKQAGDKLDYSLGTIAAISDINIYKKTCSWEAGPLTEGGCSFSYTVEKGKTQISAHYGGAGCRHNRQSYAVKLNMAGEQKKYIDHIIKAAKECNPAAYVLDKAPYLHIDIGEDNLCKSGE